MTAPAIETDLTVEETETEDESVTVDYNIASYPSDFTLSGIAEMWKDGDIVVPDYQRRFVWSIQQSSLLIDSFLSGLPVPPVFFYVGDDNKNIVVDGQQRILSIAFYFEGYFGQEYSFSGSRQESRGSDCRCGASEPIPSVWARRGGPMTRIHPGGSGVRGTAVSNNWSVRTRNGARI